MAYQYIMNNYDRYDKSLSFEENFIRGGVISLEKLEHLEEGIYKNSIELKVNEIEYVDGIENSDISIIVDDVNGTRTIYMKLARPETGPEGPKGDIGYIDVTTTGIDYTNFIPEANNAYQLGAIPGEDVINIPNILPPIDIDVANLISITFTTSSNEIPVTINHDIINGEYDDSIFLPNARYIISLIYDNLSGKWDLVANKEIIVKPGQKGDRGEPGFSFVPNVDDDGNISWSNDGELPNPETKNIKGPQGIEGPIGPKGADAYFYGPESEAPLDVGLVIDPTDGNNFPRIRYGTPDPDNSIGVDGDIYIKILG